VRQTTSMKLDPTTKQEAQEIFATLGADAGRSGQSIFDASKTKARNTF